FIQGDKLLRQRGRSHRAGKAKLLQKRQRVIREGIHIILGDIFIRVGLHCNVPVTNPAGELAWLNAFHGGGEVIDNVNAHSNAGGTGFHTCLQIVKAAVDDKRHEVVLQLFQNPGVCVDIVTNQGKARDLIVVDGGIGNLSHVCGIRVGSQNNACVNGVPVDGGGG